jgi:hypothetical protein
MGVVIPTGFAQVSLGGLIAGDAEECIITLGIELDGALTAGLAEDLYGHWSSTLDAFSSADWTFTSCRVKAGPNDSGPVDEFTAGVVQGTVTETAAVLNTAVLVKKTTLLGGRKGRGRMYTTGQAYQSIYGASGQLESGPLAALDAAWLSILGLFQAQTGVNDVVLLHSDSTTPTPITGLQPQARLATQRRRLRP